MAMVPRQPGDTLLYRRYEKTTKGKLEIAEFELFAGGFDAWFSTGTSNRGVAKFPGLENRAPTPAKARETCDQMIAQHLALGFALVASEKPTARPVKPAKVAADGPYVKRIRTMVAALERAKIKIDQLTISPPASAATTRAVAAKHELAPSALDVWSQADGIVLAWSTRGTRGQIELLSLDRIFGSWKDTVWFASTPAKDKVRKLHPIDTFVPEACAAIMLDGTRDPIVHYHYYGEDTVSLGVDIAGYLELLLATRGLLYWQLALAETLDANIGPSKTATQVRAKLAKLFPGVDLAKRRPTPGTK
jgi:hypothetical protein